MFSGFQCDHVLTRIDEGPTLGVTPQHQQPLPMTTRSVRINNNMPEAIFWRDNQGIVCAEPPTRDRLARHEIQIFIEYQLNSNTQIDFAAAEYTYLINDNREKREALMGILRRIHNGPNSLDRNFFYCITITYEEILNAGGVCYVPDVDLIIGQEDKIQSALHPRTLESKITTLTSLGEEHMATNTTTYTVYDNAGLWNGPRYFNDGFNVHCIHPQVNNHLDSGLYITHKDGDGKTRTQFFSMEEVNKNKQFSLSYDEAEYFGRPDRAYEKNIEYQRQEIKDLQVERDKKQMELKQQQQEFEDERRQLKHDHDIELTKLKQEADRAHAERKEEQERLRHEREKEQARRKEEQEQRQHERREKGEARRFVYDFIRGMMQLSALVMPIVGAIGTFFLRMAGRGT